MFGPNLSIRIRSNKGHSYRDMDETISTISLSTAARV